MAFDFKVLSQPSLADMIDAIIAELIVVGWTDDTGQKCHSAADIVGRRCYVRFTIVNDAGTDYVFIESANEPTFSGIILGTCMYLNSTMAHALTYQISIYANEYWCYLWASQALDDPTCIYPSAFGLFELKEDASIIAEPNACLNAGPSDIAGGPNTAVKFDDPHRWFVCVPSIGSVEYGCYGWMRGNVTSGENTTTLPHRKRGMAAFLENVTDWIGKLYYAEFIPNPIITDFAYGVGRNTNPTQNSLALPNANKNFENLLCRME